MTPFDIVLCILILYVISMFISIKLNGRPTDKEDWFMLIFFSVLVELSIILAGICIFLICCLVVMLCNADWYSFFHHKVI